DAVAGAQVVACHRGSGADAQVQAGGGGGAGPGGRDDVRDGVGDDEDVGVLLGEGRVGVQRAGAVRDPPVDAVQAVTGTELAHLGQGGAVTAAAREVHAADPDRGGDLHRGVQH